LSLIYVKVNYIFAPNKKKTNALIVREELFW